MATIAETVAAKVAADLTARGEVAPTTMRFIVDGVPRPKGRPRFTVMRRASGAQFVRTYTPEETAAYEKKIQTHAQVAVNQVRWGWNARDRFNVILRVFRPHFDQGGDLDNVAKIFLDACNGITWKDDRYVRGIGCAFGDPDAERPRVEVEIRRFKIAKGKAPKAEMVR